MEGASVGDSPPAHLAVSLVGEVAGKDGSSSDKTAAVGADSPSPCVEPIGRAMPEEEGMKNRCEKRLQYDEERSSRTEEQIGKDLVPAAEGGKARFRFERSNRANFLEGDCTAS